MAVVRKAQRPHWYKIDIHCCVLCGREKVYRERRYTPRPKDYRKRVTIHETACGGHFL